MLNIYHFTEIDCGHATLSCVHAPGASWPIAVSVHFPRSMIPGSIRVMMPRKRLDTVCPPSLVLYSSTHKSCSFPPTPLLFFLSFPSSHIEAFSSILADLTIFCRRCSSCPSGFSPHWCPRLRLSTLLGALFVPGELCMRTTTSDFSNSPP